MNYRLQREVENGSVVSVSLGVPEIDTYLKFPKYRCRLNTWIDGGELSSPYVDIRKEIVSILIKDVRRCN